jgi:hypothetical protein
MLMKNQHNRAKVVSKKNTLEDNVKKGLSQVWDVVKKGADYALCGVEWTGRVGAFVVLHGGKATCDIAGKVGGKKWRAKCKKGGSSFEGYADKSLPRGTLNPLKWKKEDFLWKKWVKS